VAVNWAIGAGDSYAQHLYAEVNADLALWLQTNGTALLAAKRCSQVPVPMAAQDGYGAPGLLYLAAVRDALRRCPTSRCSAVLGKAALDRLVQWTQR
jgi:hypothetical protein